jgi:tetratricopeptide (TPR) repeat protein
LLIENYQTEANNKRGRAYESKGFTDIAMEQFKAAIKLYLYNVDAYNNLGNAYMSKSMTDKAIEYFKTVFRLAP